MQTEIHDPFAQRRAVRGGIFVHRIKRGEIEDVRVLLVHVLQVLHRVRFTPDALFAQFVFQDIDGFLDAVFVAGRSILIQRGKRLDLLKNVPRVVVVFFMKLIHFGSREAIARAPQQVAARQRVRPRNALITDQILVDVHLRLALGLL